MRADMSRRRPLVVAACVIAAVLASASCHSYKPLAGPGAAVAQQVKVQFSQPRDVSGHLASGADSLLAGVSSLEGRVFAVSADTLQLTLSKISDSLGERPITTGITVKIHPDPSVAVDVLALDANKTAAVTGGALYVGLAVLIVALVAAIVGANGSDW